ncbi:hypothetical protein CSOJ01_09540 [Colletotrichum sojae]|uniref:Uncharacterized protein n=1 Tax=Colletotrichum sojae TaxID=2175907 RepID=A0A8H6J2P7_9PEZI|nr:hypothetical protein CSOJ01_09540 [Colletotrichum sojae]
MPCFLTNVKRYPPALIRFSESHPLPSIHPSLEVAYRLFAFACMFRTVGVILIATTFDGLPLLRRQSPYESTVPNPNPRQAILILTKFSRFQPAGQARNIGFPNRKPAPSRISSHAGR